QSGGRTWVLFLATAIANAVNFGLCWLFVIEWKLGVPGAGFATVLSAAVQVGIVLAALGPAPLGTRRELDRRDAQLTLRVGLPIGLQMFVEVGAFSASGIISGTMGEDAIAAHQVAITWASFTFSVAVGIGAAAAVRVGWAIGARDTPAAR